jgi:hypothetical protein
MRSADPVEQLGDPAAASRAQQIAVGIGRKLIAADPRCCGHLANEIPEPGGRPVCQPLLFSQVAVESGLLVEAMGLIDHERVERLFGQLPEGARAAEEVVDVGEGAVAPLTCPCPGRPGR